MWLLLLWWWRRYLLGIFIFDQIRHQMVSNQRIAADVTNIFIVVTIVAVAIVTAVADNRLHRCGNCSSNNVLTHTHTHI